MTTSFSKPDFNELLARINVEQFAGEHFPPPSKKEKSNWLYTCEFCGEEHKLSFSLKPVKGIVGFWKCWVCGKKGNLFSFLTEVLKWEKKDATKAIYVAAGEPWEENKKGVKKRGGKGQGTSKTNSGTGDKKRKNPLPIAPPSSAKIYQRLIELTYLSPEHREETKKKRGFTDEIIDSLILRSGGDYLPGIITQLQSEFEINELVLSGVLLRQNNALIPCQQLLDDRILIPYLNESGEVYHLRPHKLGFSDVAPQIYCREFIKDKPEFIVLTEGEFKAAALARGWGIPAIAVPGISSFAGKYFERLTGLLEEFGVKRVCVIFDNEEKGNPSFSNYKERLEDRFDTPFWAYILAYKLNKKGYQSTVGNLPDEWRENGKIDFDMALAQGRTRDDIDNVIRAAIPPKEFIESLPEAAQPIIRKKVARYFAKFSVRREFNKYVAIRTRGEEKSWEEVISNFVINIRSKYKTSEGIIRNIELVNEFGEISEDFMLEPGEMAGGEAFKKFCFSKGNYIFKGSTQDLIEIWNLEFSREAGIVINVPEKIGRLDDRTWLFGNMAIRDGKTYRPGEDGIIWVDGEGYKPQSLHLGPKDEPIEDAIPCLYDGPLDIVDIANRMRLCVGGYEAYIGIGWVVMTIFSRDIFKKYKALPFLFPHGKRESGKSSFMRWIIRFFGVESDGIALSETSQNYIMRALGYFSSLGVWFDEYRNENIITRKDGYLRSAYNRQLSGKGIKNTFGAKGYDVAGTVSISGEEVPKDSGLFTRSCFVQMSSNKRDRTYYDDLNIDSEKFSGFVYHLILNYDKYKDRILKTISDLKKMLVKVKISDRTAENWAILAGCFWVTVKEDQDFILWVKKVCKDLKFNGENDHALTQFLNDLNYLASTEDMDREKFFSYDQGKQELYIWWNGVYEAWAVHYKKKTGKEPFDKKSVLDYLKDEPFFKEQKTAKIGAISRWCCIIDISKAPDSIKEIATLMLLPTG